MMESKLVMSDIYQFVGFISIIITILYGVIQRDRQSQNQINIVKSECSEEFHEIKERFNKEIAGIREEFVKRSEFEKHIVKIETNIERIHIRLDEVLQRLMAKT